MVVVRWEDSDGDIGVALFVGCKVGKVIHSSFQSKSKATAGKPRSMHALMHHRHSKSPGMFGESSLSILYSMPITVCHIPTTRRV
jgi:hypothetical protein